MGNENREIARDMNQVRGRGDRTAVIRGRRYNEAYIQTKRQHHLSIKNAPMTLTNQIINCILVN